MLLDIFCVSYRSISTTPQNNSPNTKIELQGVTLGDLGAGCRVSGLSLCCFSQLNRNTQPSQSRVEVHSTSSYVTPKYFPELANPLKDWPHHFSSSLTSYHILSASFFSHPAVLNCSEIPEYSTFVLVDNVPLPWGSIAICQFGKFLFIPSISADPELCGAFLDGSKLT